MRVIPLALILAACFSSPFDVTLVQQQRAHPNYMQDDLGVGAFHAQGQETPSLCRDPDALDAVFQPCDAVAATLGADFGPANYSCDSAGCHGGRPPGTALTGTLELHGGEGPSCWTCHDNEWDERD